MARICPITNDVVLYLACAECENPLCRSRGAGKEDKDGH